MANEENLKPMGRGNRSESEEREMRSKGGINSGVTRRRKRDARKILAGVLKSKPIMDKETQKVIDKLGIEGTGKNKDQYDLELIATAALVQKAMRGDVKAYRLMLEIMGEDAASNRDRERMEHERQMAEMENFAPDVPDDGFIEALNSADAFDGNEDVPLDTGDGDDYEAEEE